jgi:hypothetical protein
MSAGGGGPVDARRNLAVCGRQSEAGAQPPTRTFRLFIHLSSHRFCRIRTLRGRVVTRDDSPGMREDRFRPPGWTCNVTVLTHEASTPLRQVDPSPMWRTPSIRSGFRDIFKTPNDDIRRIRDAGSNRRQAHRGPFKEGLDFMKIPRLCGSIVACLCLPLSVSGQVLSVTGPSSTRTISGGKGVGAVTVTTVPVTVALAGRRPQGALIVVSEPDFRAALCSLCLRKGGLVTISMSSAISAVCALATHPLPTRSRAMPGSNGTATPPDFSMTAPTVRPRSKRVVHPLSASCLSQPYRRGTRWPRSTQPALDGAVRQLYLRSRRERNVRSRDGLWHFLDRPEALWVRGNIQEK